MTDGAVLPAVAKHIPLLKKRFSIDGVSRLVSGGLYHTAPSGTRPASEIEFSLVEQGDD
jgi:hypothetical protein